MLSVCACLVLCTTILAIFSFDFSRELISDVNFVAKPSIEAKWPFEPVILLLHNSV
jgi:hypothetical protein